MDYYERLESEYQNRVDKEALREAAIIDFAESLLTVGEFYYNNYEYRLDYDVLFKVQEHEDIGAVIIDMFHDIDSDTFIKAKERLDEIYREAAYELAEETII